MEQAKFGFSAAVLAGCKSKRMGSDKAFLQISGEFLFKRQLRCLREAGADELLILGQRGADYSGYDEQSFTTNIAIWALSRESHPY